MTSTTFRWNVQSAYEPRREIPDMPFPVAGFRAGAEIPAYPSARSPARPGGCLHEPRRESAYLASPYCTGAVLRRFFPSVRLFELVAALGGRPTVGPQ